MCGRGSCGCGCGGCGGLRCELHAECHELAALASALSLTLTGHGTQDSFYFADSFRLQAPIASEQHEGLQVLDRTLSLSMQLRERHREARMCMSQQICTV